MKPYPIGTPGVAWGPSERAQWLARQRRQRSYTDDVVARIDRLAARLDVELHETTDSDESEYRPALAARDGQPFEPGLIPDGFYVVDDSENPQPGFQDAIVQAVARITHIAPADARNEIIGSAVVAPGV